MRLIEAQRLIPGNCVKSKSLGIAKAYVVGKIPDSHPRVKLLIKIRVVDDGSRKQQTREVNYRHLQMYPIGQQEVKSG